MRDKLNNGFLRDMLETIIELNLLHLAASGLIVLAWHCPTPLAISLGLIAATGYMLSAMLLGHALRLALMRQPVEMV